MTNEINITKKKIEDLIEAEYNPRKLSPEQERTISDSIKRFGIVDPVLVNMHPDRKNVIIGGHQRTKVAKKLGFEEMPCVELSLTLDQEKELNIRLNKNTGEFDFDALEEFFNEEDLIEWGFNQEELDFFEPEEEDFPDLGDGEDAQIMTITLTVSTEQKELIDDAIQKAKSELDCLDAINENSNGNAINAICRAFINE